MASFSYVALTPEGRRKKGIIEADSEKQVRQKLRKQSLVPVEVKSAAGQLKGDTGKGSRFTLMRTSMNSAALCLATRQLATLVEATIPVEEALSTVAEQCEKPGQKALLSEVRSQVLEGKSLAEALSRFPRVFSASTARWSRPERSQGILTPYSRGSLTTRRTSRRSRARSSRR